MRSLSNVPARRAWGVITLLISMLSLGGVPFSNSAASEPPRPPNEKQSLPSLQGQKAVDQLKQQDLYSSLQEAVAATCYEAEWQAAQGAYELKNSAQGLRAQVTASEFRVTSLGKAPQESWQLGMKLAGYGYGDSLSSVTSSEMTAKGSRVSVAKSVIRNPQSAIEEWYFNSAEGIEQGFTINSRPQSAIKLEPLRLMQELSGSFEARLDESGQAISFSNGSTSLVYNKLEAFDARGRRLQARMELKANRVTLVVDDAGAEYPVTIDPLLTQQLKLTASDGAALDFLGTSVAVSGDTAVVGATKFTSLDSAYVFVRSGATWTQQQKLTASDGASADEFGTSVAISGDTVVVGAFFDDVGFTDQGSAYVFVRSGTTWTQQQKLTAGDGAALDQFGTSVAISGDTVVVGAEFDGVGFSNQGSAYVFVRSGTTWTQQQKLTASDGALNDEFGFSVAISGDTVVVGAIIDNVGANSNQGSAYVFVRGGASWTQQQQLIASDGAAGDLFGRSVAISGDTVVVGADGDDVGFTDQGSAYVFVRSGTAWTQQQKLTASDGAGSDQFGISVAISGDTVVVGVPFEQNLQGSAYVFVRSGTAWTQQQKLTASDGAADDAFGLSVGISGDAVVIGANRDDVGANTDQGSAYVFACGLTEQAQVIANDGQAGDLLGRSVSISGDTVVVGAENHDVGTSTDQGSAYIFVRSGMGWSQQAMLTASDGAASDNFGVSVAIDGNTVVVGAWFADPTFTDQGAAYVFVRSGTTWSQQQKLFAIDGAGGDLFGGSVAIGGDTVVVGAPLDDGTAGSNEGSAYVFVRSGTVWSQQQKLIAASDQQADARLGTSVAISGDTVFVGAPLHDTLAIDDGAAYVFTRSGTVWSQLQKLIAMEVFVAPGDDHFGASVAISGNTAVVGANLRNVGTNANQGAAFVFTRAVTFFSQVQKLVANDGAADDNFGSSVAISGSTIVVGADSDDVDTPDQGSAYVFIPFNTTWQQQRQLIARDAGAGDFFGRTVAINGQTVVVGALGNDALGNPDPVVNQGSAYIIFSSCNTAPTITAATTFTRKQGTPAALATLATVSDFQDAVGGLAVTAISIPSGITLPGLANSSGTITALVAAACNALIGSQSITLQVTDSNGATATANATVNVTANPSPILGAYPSTTISTGGSVTVTPSGAPSDNGSIVSLTASAPGFAGNYSVSSGTGVVSISNSTPQGVYLMTVTAVDNCGSSTSTSFTLTVGGVITVNPATLPNGGVSVAYNQTLTAAGGTAPYTFAVTNGTLPPGLSLSSAGTLSGTPTNGGNFNFTVRATDSSPTQDTGSRAYSLVISGPTNINLTSFDATRYDDGVFISWQTGYEVNNLGFNLHREEGGKLTLVNSQLIAGSALVVGQGVEVRSGYSYTWWDEKIPDCQLPIADCQSVRYWLEDVDLNSHSTWHGPFAAVASGDKQRPASVEQARLLASLVTSERDSAAVEPRATLIRAASEKQIPPPIASVNPVKIAIKQTGWYRLTQPELIGAGLYPAVDPRRLQLVVDGRELAISVAGEMDGRLDAGDAGEFYATGLDSPYSTSRICWLIAGTKPGKRITALSSAANPAAGGSFAFTIERKDRGVYFAALRNGERENFFGSVVYTQPLDQALTVHHLDTQTPVGAGLEVALQGVTNSSHQVAVQLNGSTIGHLVYQGQANQVAYFRIPGSLVREGRNTVTLRTAGGPSDLSLVDYIRLTYQHGYSADADSLVFTAEGQQQVTISGFTTKKIRVFDVTDSEAVQELIGEIVDEGKAYAMAIRVAGPGERTLLAVTNESAKRAAKVVADAFSNLHSSANAADLVIVTHREFIEQAGLLASLRRNEGLSAMLVYVEDIYDEFSYGQKTPQALKDFLMFARNNWKAAPRYLLLFGDASYDPKNYLGFGELDLVPTKLIDTVFMESASDDWLADFDGDGIADIAVGRLPAGSKAEADLMIKKLFSYEESRPSQETLLAADANDGYDFEAVIDRLRGLVPANLGVVEVKRGQMGDAAAKTVLIQALDRGQKLAAYSGHGSANSWRGNLLTNADASALTNSDKLTVFVMMNCLNGYFHHPQTESLSEALLKAQQGGAIAVWASSAMTFAEGQEEMTRELYRQLFGDRSVRLGDAVRRAKTVTFDPDVRRTWILFGDPTARIKNQ